MKKEIPLIMFIIIAITSLLFIMHHQPIEKKVSFKKDICPIFCKRCISCHGVDGALPDLRPVVAYKNIDTCYYIMNTCPDSCLISSVLTAHYDSTTAMEKIILKRWIRQGAKNN